MAPRLDVSGVRLGREYLEGHQQNINNLQRNSGDELWIAFRIQFPIPALVLRNAFAAY
jgi:hypothetical protein